MELSDAIESLKRYRDDGIPTGDFLRACLCNNLKEACGRADSTSRYILFEITSFIVNEMPAVCQGSEAKVEAWLKTGGLKEVGLVWTENGPKRCPTT